MKRLGIIGMIVVGLVAAPALTATATSEVTAAGGGKFKPKKFAGKWKGKWKNQTFNTKGSAKMKLKAKGKKFIATFDLGGSAFGCPDPDPRKRVMKKGKGPNTWNKKGFNVRYDNGQGPVVLKYKAKRSKFTGSGTSPCTPDITYAFDGKMTKKKVTAETEIFDGNGNVFARSTMKMKKKK